VLSACAARQSEKAGNLMALLRRYEVEAARDAAREVAGVFADEAALALTLAYHPAALIGLDRERLSDAA
jgi:hypothetical protein